MPRKTRTYTKLKISLVLIVSLMQITPAFTSQNFSGLRTNFGITSASLQTNGCTTTIVNTLGTATPETRFNVERTSGSTLSDTQYIGPKFVLTSSTLITEIGGFFANAFPNRRALTVQIRPAKNGLPDPNTLIASFVLSKYTDQNVVSYESAAINLNLPAGTYFALFAPQSGDTGWYILGNADNYLPELASIGFLNPSTGATSSFERRSPFRILANCSTTNPIDDNAFFVQQQYRDFLNREADAPGLAFWQQTLQGYLNNCGTADNAETNTCRARAKASVSEAFFASVEFQQTGYLVYRLYKTSYPESATRPRGLVRFSEFLRDAQAIGNGVVVNADGWEQKLEANKVSFIREFVQRVEFTTRFPETLTGEQFVTSLLTTAGLPTSGAERDAALAVYGNGGVDGRARALRSVAESNLLFRKEFNQAFVLMQYFGYLRRNPDEGEDANRPFAGYDFWLAKLISESGDTTRFQKINDLLEPTKRARMVEAFVITGEYRRRFGPE